MSEAPRKATEVPPPDKPPGLPENSLESLRPGRGGAPETQYAGPPPTTFGARPSLTPWRILESDSGPPAEGEAEASYVLGREIARGGFGEVWEALQVSLGRTVAVKRLRDDLHAAAKRDETKARFYTETFRQEAYTTGCLEHPNIVPIYDLGEDPQGRPLLAMKMVRGRQWHDLIVEDWAKLPVPEFLAKHLPILASMTQAVAFAHARGIVHRDLKPSQVMVGEYGEVLLMDWGLGMAYDAALHAREWAALGGQHVAQPRELATNPAGTPAFMAPEQTEATAENIGPWTDVYLLGGTLYHLLSGKLPHEGSTSTIVFIMARIGEVVPVEQAAGEREVPPELAKLCERAMAAKIPQRMASAKEFLAALQDYMTGATRRRESIAITDAVAERMEETRRDYAALSECLAEIGRARALWFENRDAEFVRELIVEEFARLALRNRDLTLARAQIAMLPPGAKREAMEAGLAEAEAAARRREQQRRMLAGAVAVLLAALAGAGIWADRQRREALRQRDAAAVQEREASKQRSIAERRSQQAEELIKFMLSDLADKLEPIGQLRALADVGSRAIAYFDELGPDELKGATLARKALALRQAGLVQVDLGNSAEAEKLLRESLQIARSMVAKDATDDALQALAETLNHLGFLTIARGDTEGTRRAWEEALSITRRRVERHPEDLQAARNLAVDLMNLAGLVPRAEGLPLFRESVDVLTRLLERFPGNTDVLHDLCTAYSNLSGSQSDAKLIDESLASSAEAVRIGEELAGSDAGRADWTESLARAEMMRGFALARSGVSAHEEALRVYGAAADRWRKLSSRDPENADWRTQYALCLNQRATILAHAWRGAEALAELDKARAIFRELVDRDPGSIRWKTSLAHSWGRSGDILDQMGRSEEALACYDRQLALDRAIAADSPSDTQRLATVAIDQGTRALVLASLGRGAEAEAAAREQLQLFGTPKSDEPRVRANYAQALRTLAEAELASGKENEARNRLGEARGILESILIKDPEDAFALGRLAATLACIADLCRKEGDSGGMKDAAKRALQALEPGGDSADPRSAALIVRFRLALGRVDEARPLAEKLLAAGYRPSAFVAACRENGIAAP